MKIKILSLVLVLSVVLSLGIAIPASASTAASTQAPAVKTANDEVGTEVVYDEAYVALTGHDNTGNGTASNPWRTITYAVNRLPYDRVTDPLDPPNTTLPVPDRINVNPSGVGNWYGGTGTIAENIVVTQPVIIRSNGGNYNNTIVNVAGQNPAVDQVIAVSENCVTIDGLWLTGAPVGVFAQGIDPTHPLHNITVSNCRFTDSAKENECDSAIGIYMQWVKYAVVDHNKIHINDVDEAFGILMDTCFQATVTNNGVGDPADLPPAGCPQQIYYAPGLQGNCLAIGILMLDCPRSCVDRNVVNVQANKDALAIGIKAGSSFDPNFNPNPVYDGSDLIQITNNTVTVMAAGDNFALAFGIKVCESDRTCTQGNTVCVAAKATSNQIGFFLAEGIWLNGCNESAVQSNTVNVTGMAPFNSNGATVTCALDDEQDAFTADMADINDVLINVTHFTVSATAGAGIVVGIKVTNGQNDCGLDSVCLNAVNVKLAADFVAGSDNASNPAVAAGAGVAFGILGVCSPKLVVNANGVNVDRANAFPPDGWRDAAAGDRDVMMNIKVSTVEAMDASPVGVGLGLNIALGITVFDCGLAQVTNNAVFSASSMYIQIKSAANPDQLSDVSSSAVGLLNSELLNAIYNSVTTSLNSESINAQFTGDPPSIQTFDLGGALCASVAILAIDSDGVCITGNTQAQGIATLNGVTSSKASSDQDEAEGWGAGLALGGGIWVICSDTAYIAGNGQGTAATNIVSGAGYANIQVGALHMAPVNSTDAEAYGGGAGVGIGILVVGDPQTADITSQADLDHFASFPVTQVVGNKVAAIGYSDNVCVSAADENLPNPDAHTAIGVGLGLGLAVGIGTIWTPCIVIQNNAVTADGKAIVCVAASSKEALDPLSVGGAAGIGIGIITVCSHKAQILNNTSTGTGQAKGFVMAIEKAILPKAYDTASFGGSLGFGAGIIVFSSCGSLVSGNSVANGIGDAKTAVFAIDQSPLDTAFALALAAGIGNGIAVVCSPWTDVVECNTAAGVGTARLCDWAWADFNYYCYLGVSVSIDILEVLDPDTLSTSEASFDAEADHWNFQFGKVNYNSMVDVAPIGTNGPPCVIDRIDAGLLKIGWPCLDARFNWWNDKTGPSGFGPGLGEPVLWCGKPVLFTPWLYVVHTQALTDQLGYFGFYLTLVKGVNAVSTPIALEGDQVGSVVHSRTWADVLANSGITSWKYLQKWDAQTQTWSTINNPANENFDPLTAYYIYLFDQGPKNLILMVDAKRGTMPIKTLYTGWNLIGPNPLFPECSIPANDSLISVEQVANGTPGYTQVISPIVRGQPAWYYVRGMKCEVPCMLSGHGYWVYMLQGANLVGFGFTPLPDKLSYIQD